MGSQADVFCAACGYKTVVTIGGGMDNYHEFAGWPVYCKTCSSVATGNLCDKPIRCLNCNSDEVTPYGEIKVRTEWKPEMPTPMFQWYDHVYFDDLHDCPRCHQKSLKFDTSKSILFD